MYAARALRAGRQFARRGCAGAAGAERDALVSAADVAWDNLIEAEWVDIDSTIPEVSEAEDVIDRYRKIYTSDQAESPAPHSLYQKMANLYVAKEAAKLVELYAAHMENLMRDHMDMVGFVGNNTEIPEGEEQRVIKTLDEYVQFVNSVENDRIQRKIEAQLGRKVILLRMAISIENFSSRFGPIACDRMITNINSPSTVVMHKQSALEN